jgi:SAM-dependent methyltransferase
MPISDYVLDYQGFCPICDQHVRFQSVNGWFRDYLVCDTCEQGSVPRERALTLALKLYCPDFLEKSIHESSPGDRGISRVLRLNGKSYIGSHFYKDVPKGEMKGIYRSENLESMTFSDETFDLFISLDVFEHVFNPEMAIKEVWRTLKPGGMMISTWPIRKYQTEATDRRANIDESGEIIYYKDIEIHGNPIDGSGSLLTVDYGYDIHKELSLWAPFDVSIIRFSDKTHGVLG